jgi:hypothetical protein
MRVRLTVRVAGATAEAAVERAHAVMSAVPGVRTLEPHTQTEPGDGVVGFEVTSETDLRDAICRALVQADVGVLEIARQRDLEATFRALLGEAAGARRRKAKGAAEPAGMAAGGSEPEPAAPTGPEASS